MYWAAILKAITKITSREKWPPSFVKNSHTANLLSGEDPCSQNVITCLVFGAGLGRLVEFCIDATKARAVSANIHAVDANPLAVDCLRNYFSDYSLSKDGLATTVTVHSLFSLFPGMQRQDLPSNLKLLYGKCDLIVSELLGCFGCDEFLPELTATLCNLFRKPNGGICIPKDWQSFVVPVQTHSLHCQLKRTSNFVTSCPTYTVGIPEDCIFMSCPQTLWKGSCENYQTPCNNEGVEFSLSPYMVKESHEVAKHNQPTTSSSSIENTSSSLDFQVHGVIGYFTSCLYDNIYIDTRHSCQRNSFHWECFYMPLQEPVPVPVDTPDCASLIVVTVKRSCWINKTNKHYSDSFYHSASGLSHGMRLGLTYSWKVQLFVKSRKEVALEKEESETGNVIYLNYP